MLETIRQELAEHEFYGLANDRIEWLIEEVERLEQKLKLAKRAVDILRREE